MSQIEIIKCHGSRNDFVMVDTTREDMSAVDWSAFARMVSDRESGIGSDGVLLVVRHADGVYGMDMLNPDGTHAEMCGNGIRCVARLADERGYLDRGVLRSGGHDYRILRGEDMAEGIKCYAVDIDIRTHSNDFAFFKADEHFVGRVIEPLHSTLQFTALNLGNPHIVALVDRADVALLEALGERVKELKSLFPHGVNVSLYERRSSSSIFVATYERGAGITQSCGTAMTASSTAAALLGIVERGERIEVRNRGGKVYCSTTIDEGRITTRLEGNATFDWWGSVQWGDDNGFGWSVERRSDEDARWAAFVQGF